MTDRDARRRELEHRRSELQARVDAIRADYRRGLAADSGEQALELENADVLAELERTALEQMAAIDAELVRLADT